MNYEKVYWRIIARAMFRLKLLEYTENHHIIPKFYWPEKDGNLYTVPLTAREHYIAHLCLTKFLGMPFPMFWSGGGRMYESLRKMAGKTLANSPGWREANAKGKQHRKGIAPYEVTPEHCTVRSQNARERWKKRPESFTNQLVGLRASNQTSEWKQWRAEENRKMAKDPSRQDFLSKRTKGKKWWVNNNGETRREFESPGPEWQQRRKWLESST